MGSKKTGAAGAPPPPPPPPPSGAAPAAAPSGGIGAVFAELNRGEEVTKGLRKVDKSEMTHKNPELRASSVVPAGNATPKRPIKPSKPAALSGKKPHKMALEGTKWIIVSSTSSSPSMAFFAKKMRRNTSRTNRA